MKSELFAKILELVANTTELSAERILSKTKTDDLVNITQRLCFSSCADNTPVFQPQFAIKSISPVGTNLYAVVVHVEGIIAYVPCNGGCGCTKQQPLSQDFPIVISSETVPTVTLAQGASINGLSATACQSCSRTFACETPITLTVA